MALTTPPALLDLAGLMTTLVQVANDGFCIYRDAHENLVGKKKVSRLSRGLQDRAAPTVHTALHLLLTQRRGLTASSPS